jgi:ABC-type uncharacterized transport system auxiliary subunit
MSVTTLRLFFLLAAALLGGCGMLAGRPHPVSHHVLEVAPAVAEVATVPRRGVLLLRDTETPGVFQSVRLVYSRAPGVLSYYQYARWSDMPARSLNAHLRQRLNAAGPFESVVPLGAGVQAEYQLNTRLRDFLHDAAHSPGMARVTLEAELVHRPDARLIARQVFTAEAPAASFDAAGAAAALGQASGRLLDDLTLWLARVRPPDAR